MAETTVFSACPHDCPDTCAMLTTVRDGKVIDVRGNPDHPFTQGGLCVKVNDYQNRVYSEDRVLYPMRRVGAKGAGEFERISWDEALDEISSRWNAIIDEDGPSAILPYSYLGTEGILNGLHVGDAFFNKLGAAVSERTFCDSGAITAFFMTCGPTAAVDPESFVYSKYIVLWAINTISTNLHHWPFIVEAQRRGAKVVVIDPVATRTAKKADWHIPIKPGTDAALALGMINVIIAEDLVDHDYVEKYTVGYDELAERAANFPPDVVAEITGIAADDIRTLAREFATTQPSVIRMGVAIERNASGGNAVRALSCLPALVGSWRHCGGGILHMPIWAFPVKFDDLSRADWIREGTPVINQWRLGAALTGELDQEVNSLFVYNANPVVMVPEQAKVLQGLAREDLVRQANWQKVGGASPPERRSNRTTFLREPCVGSREGAGEASVAAWTGRAIEHRKSDDPGCRGFQIGRRQYRRHRFGEMSASPAVSENPCTFARLLLGPWEVFKLPRLS